MPPDETAFTGRCYCGKMSLTGKDPRASIYCHCSDCRRWTGAPLPAFAAFSDTDIRCAPDPGPGFSAVDGVTRWTCPDCGSPLMARFDYLPGQIYVPLGVLDNAAALPPTAHARSQDKLPWLHLSDDAERFAGSSRDHLNAQGDV